MNKSKLQKTSGHFWRSALIATALACSAVYLPHTVIAQPCLHGGSLTENTFSTNCVGQVVFGKTHIGSTVGVLIRANMVDDCPGDQTLITNVTDTISFNAGSSFTTTNLLSQPILLPSLGSSSNIVNVTSGPFAGSAYTYVVPSNAAPVITNTATQIARDTNSATNPNGLLGGVGSAQIQVLMPRLTLTKFCTNGIGQNGLIGFSGTVLNSGNTILTNVFVFNNQPSNNTPVLGPITLTNGESRTFSGAYRPANFCAPATDILSAFGTDELLCTVSATATQTCSLVLTPCINVTKVCATNLLFLAGTNATASLNFSGIVSNCGNVTLTNISLSDDLISGGAIFRIIPALAPGATTNWSTNLIVGAAFCNRSNVLNTITARGTNLCNLGQGVVDTDSCSFTVVCANPRLTVTKVCASPIGTNIGSSLTVTGLVCNPGDVPFTNVIVVDAQPGIPVNATNVLGSLNPGQCKPYSFTYTATTCATNIDTVTVTAFSVGGVVVTNASAQCLLCCPGIAVEKTVACVLPNSTCPASPADYRATATGILGNTGNPALDYPGFCYRMVVRNTGQDPLTNIVVSDPFLGVQQTFAGPLAVGATLSVENLRTNLTVTTTNVVTVRGQCAGARGNGALVSATTNVIAVVVPANLVCDKLITSADDRDNDPSGEDNHVTLPQDGAVHFVTNAVRVCNNGLVELTNITISDPSLQTLGCVMPAPFNLATGQCATVVLCVQAITSDANFCATNFTNQVFVTALPNPGTNNFCVFGQSNIVASSSCESVIECEVQQICVGTPGYWINHPEAWPVEQITIGGVTYSKATALALLKLGSNNAGDKTLILFRHLVSAKLNVLSGAVSSCIQDTINAADAWFQTYGPVGSNVRAGSEAWRIGEPLKNMLDAYNNALLCATLHC